MVSKNLIIIIDNYDSFTYNIYQMMGTLVNDDPDTELKVIRNDAVSVDDLKKMHPAKLIISPGPGTPSDAFTTTHQTLTLRACAAFPV